jgi:hypothetical protein
MTASTPDDLAALIVAWHNRHPLARRIDAAQVHGAGIVRLPFAGPVAAAPKTAAAAPEPPAGASLRDRARAAHAVAGPAAPVSGDVPTSIDRSELVRAFSENFVAPVSPRRAAQFALRHGAVHHAPAERVRNVAVDACRVPPGANVTFLTLRTAAIELGARRLRVLAGGPGVAAVIGPRHWNWPLIGGAGLALLLVCAAGQWLPAQAPPGPAFAKAGLPAHDAAAMAAAEPSGAPAPASQGASAAAAPGAALIAAADPEPADPPQAPPPIVQPDAEARIDIRPRLDTLVAREARRQSRALRTAAVPGAAPAETSAAARRSPPKPGTELTSASMAEPGAAPKAATAAGLNFALVTRETRSRAASLVLLGYLESTTLGLPSPTQHKELVPSEAGWRAAWWPFATRQEAERARKRLAGRGLEVEVVEF